MQMMTTCRLASGGPSAVAGPSSISALAVRDGAVTSCGYTENKCSDNGRSNEKPRHKCNQCDGIPLSLLPPTDRRRNCFRNGRNPSSKAAKRPRCRLQTKWTRFDHILGQYGRIVERFSRIFVSVVQYCHVWQLVAQSWLLVDACRPRPFHWLRLSTLIIVLP